MRDKLPTKTTAAAEGRSCGVGQSPRNEAELPWAFPLYKTRGGDSLNL